MFIYVIEFIIFNMADKNTKFKDLKKGDHLYWISMNLKTYEPYFCEYELVDDMTFIGPERFIYSCHVIPVNYNPKTDYLFGKKWDGKTTKEWRTGWQWNKTGDGCQMTTCLKYAEKYYKDMYKRSIEYLQKDYDKILKLLNYHKAQLENFDFNRKL